MKQIFVNVDCLTLPREEKRKVRKDFDLSKRYHVDVSECTIEEKKEVQQAFFDAGFQWMSVGKDHKHLYAMRYTNTINDGTTATRYLFWSISTENCNMSAKEFLELVYEPEKQEMKQIIVNVYGLTRDQKMRVNEALAKIKNVRMCAPLLWDDVIVMYGPSVDKITVGFGYLNIAKPTHTPQQVLEMAGMTTKRKVRADFDKRKEYSVDVSGCTEEEKKEVQQAFFDVGFVWESGGKEYQHLDKVQYTNTTGSGSVTGYCMHATTTEDCNMKPDEFFNHVYEPEQQGHIHADLMAQYAEDAKTTDKPWRLWQYKTGSPEWAICSFHPEWNMTSEYRRKPKTHMVHGVEVPDLRIVPKTGDRFYLADPTKPEFTCDFLKTATNSYGSEWTERGLCYEYTEEGKQAAILHAKIMLGIAY